MVEIAGFEPASTDIDAYASTSVVGLWYFANTSLTDKLRISYLDSIHLSTSEKKVNKLTC